MWSQDSNNMTWIKVDISSVRELNTVFVDVRLLLPGPWEPELLIAQAKGFSHPPGKKEDAEILSP